MSARMRASDEETKANRRHTDVEWKPPFCANDADEVKCPKCGDDGCVRVREKERYFAGDCCEAYCAVCHADLEVQVNVEVTFSDAEVAGQ